MCGSAAFSALCVGVLYIACSLLAPNLLRWLLGVLSPGMFIMAIGAALLFGTITAVVHLEGHRMADGTTGSVRKTQVHTTSVVIAGMSAVAMMLVMPYVDRRAFARLRALAPI